MSAQGWSGYQQPGTAADPFNAIAFIVQGMLARLATATLVKVMGVTNAGGVSPVGFVDILPLVNQVDGDNNAIPHVTIYRCPYFRIQGGANAVIIDPQVGDLGIAVFADRDISSATANKAQANPGSGRMFDMADGLYIGGVLNGAPTQFVQFNAGGITISSPNAVTIDAPSVTVNAATAQVNATTSMGITTPELTITGATLFDGPISQVPGTQGATAATFDGPLQVTNEVTGGGKHLSTHIHTGGTIAGDTGAPV